MNHHYTVWQRAKWLIPGCTEAGVHGDGSLWATHQTVGPSGKHQTGNLTAFIPREHQGTKGHVLRTTLQSSWFFGKLWLCSQRIERIWGSKTLSLFWLWCHTLKLWGLLLSRNWEACGIMASQKVTRNSNPLQGKQKNMLRKRYRHQPGCALHHITETYRSEGRSWPFPETCKKNTEAPQPPSRNHSPRRTGKLGQGAHSPEPSLGLALFSLHFFLLHSCVQFSVLGVFKGTFILGPGFSSFMVIQLPLRAKECLKSLKPSRES